MKLTKAEKTEHGVRLVFEDDSREVVKFPKISDCAQRIAIDIDPHAMLAILRAGREALRDFAYMNFGDDWRKHVPIGGFWSATMTEEESKIVMQAKALLCA